MAVFAILQTYFDYLFLQNKAEIYSSKIWSANSGLLLLRTAKLKIKLITDMRDGFYLETGSLSNEDWIELSVLYAYMNSEEKGNLNVEEVSRIFKEEFEKIENVFSSESTFQELLDFKKERAKKRFGKGF